MSKSCECSLQSRKVFTTDFNYSLYILCFLLQSNETVQCCLIIVHGSGVKMAWSTAPKHTTVHQAYMLIYLFNLLLIYLICTLTKPCSRRFTSKVQVDSGPAVACSKVKCMSETLLFISRKVRRK